MFALSGKNMKAWWQKYIDIHTQVFSFIADHSTIFLYFIAIILVIDMGNRLLSVLGWHP
jgi:hypothetical protein